MTFTFFKNTILLALLVCFSCGSQTKEKNDDLTQEVLISSDSAQDKQNQDENSFEPEIIVGAAQVSEYLPALSDKNVGVIANQTSVVGNQHLVDLLLERNISVKKVFEIVSFQTNL